ncbi:MAG: SET domain-containing protein [Alphaproteobacteria bacterium]|nr:SET domain-containing protein [Alphaproteobacteria bacterium]MBP7758213.1 SET domain-containing protein [Alphaproteobacteria bacterium]MBP7761644.1 SET domain-containing protein [Alphaproteobacteria bacterium]MBP7904004.1 SET domain-containing protein [Alphaproteobacteria bacterium]
MLLVKGFIGPDSYGGNGLFAGEDIQKGTMVWRYCPSVTKFLSVKEYLAMSPAEREKIGKYPYPHADVNGDMDATGVFISNDMSKHVNHSSDPAIGPLSDLLSNDWSEHIDYALRDIKYGEEITCDYMICDPDNVVHNLGIMTCKTFLIMPLPRAAVKASGSLVTVKA